MHLGDTPPMAGGLYPKPHANLPLDYGSVGLARRSPDTLWARTLSASATFLAARR